MHPTLKRLRWILVPFVGVGCSALTMTPFYLIGALLSSTEETPVTILWWGCGLVLAAVVGLPSGVWYAVHLIRSEDRGPITPMSGGIKNRAIYKWLAAPVVGLAFAGVSVALALCLTLSGYEGRAKIVTPTPEFAAFIAFPIGLIAGVHLVKKGG